MTNSIIINNFTINSPEERTKLEYLLEKLDIIKREGDTRGNTTRTQFDFVGGNWRFLTSKPRCSHKLLAFIKSEVPRNLVGSSDIGILVSLWCDWNFERLLVEGKRTSFKYGFREGEISVSVNGCSIKTEGRSSIVAFSLAQESLSELIKNNHTGLYDSNCSGAG